MRNSLLNKSSTGKTAIESTLNALAAKLTTDSQTALIAQIGGDFTKVPSVARAYLQQQGLL